MTSSVNDILDRAPKLAALVVGDVCLDRWCRYDPRLAEPSRETGIPRTAVTSTEVTPGAAGTVANNLAALGVGRVSVLGVIGADGHGFELRRALEQRGIEGDLLVESAHVQTFTYTKLINCSDAREDQPRVNFVNPASLPAEAVRAVLDRLQRVLDLFDIVIVSDQAESGCGGVVNDAVRSLIQEMAPVYPDKVVLVDSRTHIADFRNIIAKPNHIEAGRASRELFGSVDYGALREHIESPLLIVTHASDGVLLVTREEQRWVRTRPVEHPVDICGAGDSFAAGFTLAYAATRDAVRAAEFGNRVASITIMKPGTGTASPAELRGVGCVKTLAIDIGGTKFSVALFDGEQMVRRESRNTDREGGRGWLVPQLDQLIGEWKRDVTFDGCGIGFGGPVNFATQMVQQSTHVGGWEGFPLTRHIADTLGGVPVVMDNDANVGALGEYYYGAGKGCSPLFYMTLSTGIGGGILLDGQNVRGADGWAGEIGHINLVPDGPECLCGSHGCFERMCCGLWLERDFGRSARELIEDPAFVERYVVLLARGLKTCIMVLNPARIVIGGGLSKAGDRLFGPLRAELSRQITAWSGARQDVQPAALGDDSVLYGALQLARTI